MKALRLHVKGTFPPATLVIKKLPIRIGRDDANDVRLDEPTASRMHARLDVDAGQIVLCDEGSANGTWVLLREKVIRLVPHRPTSLTPHDGCFLVGLTRIHAEIVNWNDPPGAVTQDEGDGEGIDVSVRMDSMDAELDVETSLYEEKPKPVLPPGGEKR